MSGRRYDRGFWVIKEIEVRVHGDAVSADSDAWSMDMAIGLGIGGRNYLKHIDPRTISKPCKLVR
jgi:hypothetical protein